ncbi:GumC family protein [Devosia aquimaris]|uniref:GumC family protein n=1 Tax=Devosia aquimaris TaxID=2866214 RepID=UPI001CD102C6|nr:Wzz/FepE/Etk N-terminal domain-containing protein [Devosia sp. CJK-A8-3]
MEETEFDIRGIFSLLRRQLRLILVTVIAVVGLATLVAFSLTPTYTASALVLVDPSNKNLLNPETQMTTAGADSARIDSEVELARSDNVLLRVISDRNLTTDKEFGVSLGLTARILSFLRVAEPTLPSGQQALNETLTALRNATSVQRRGLTYLVSVQVRSEDPAKAADLANAITEVYIQDQLASKVNSVMSSRDILQARIAQARDAIGRSESSFDDFIQSNMQLISEDTGRTDLANMQAELQALAEARTSDTSTIAEVQKSLQDNNWSSLVSELQSDALAELERQRTQLVGSLNSATDASAESLRAQLAEIEQRLRTTATAEVNNLEQSVRATQDRETSLRQNLREEVLKSPLSGDVLAQLYELQQGAELARTQYQTLLARAQELGAQADLQLADSRIVSPALEPQSPSFPNKALIIAVAAVFAIGLGVVLALLYENLIGGFTSEEQVSSVLRTPVAATIPRERAKSERESIANLMVTSPLSVFAESVRRTRAAVENSMKVSATPRPGGKVVMVTSTMPNEGKTTLALALARSYSLFGQSTLLIDCDLRKPSIHRHLNLEPDHSLLDLLSETTAEKDFSQVVLTDALTATSMIVGSRRSDIPTDQLLAGKAFQRLLDAARASFDVVVLDTPPVGPVVDGLYLAQFVDAIVFVTRWASTSQREARRAVESLTVSKPAEAKITTVLNQQDLTRSGYGRKYGSYYSYNT